MAASERKGKKEGRGIVGGSNKLTCFSEFLLKRSVSAAIYALEGPFLGTGDSGRRSFGITLW